MRLTYYGHSCFSVYIDSTALLFDPFITPNPLASHIDAAAIEADFILITHGHEDHIADATLIAKRTGALVVSNFEITTWLAKQGVQNVHPMNHGGAKRFGFGRVKYVNAVHSSMLPDGSYGGNPGGFVVEGRDGAFYYSGDTALTTDMKLIAEEFALRFAVLPIGDNFTMDAVDAARAAGVVGASKVIGVHYDTFPLIEIDRAEALSAFQKAGVALHLLAIGESRDF